MSDEEYEVEEIRSYMKYRDAFKFRAFISFSPPCGNEHEHSKFVYEVKWEGYDSDVNTWEPESQLVECGLLDKFKKKMGLNYAHIMHTAEYDFSAPVNPKYDAVRYAKALSKYEQKKKLEQWRPDRVPTPDSSDEESADRNREQNKQTKRRKSEHRDRSRSRSKARSDSPDSSSRKKDKNREKSKRDEQLPPRSAKKDISTERQRKIEQVFGDAPGTLSSTARFERMSVEQKNAYIDGLFEDDSSDTDAAKKKQKSKKDRSSKSSAYNSESRGRKEDDLPESSKSYKQLHVKTATEHNYLDADSSDSDVGVRRRRRIIMSSDEEDVTDKLPPMQPVKTEIKMSPISPYEIVPSDNKLKLTFRRCSTDARPGSTEPSNLNVESQLTADQNGGVEKMDTTENKEASVVAAITDTTEKKKKKKHKKEKSKDASDENVTAPTADAKTVSSLPISSSSSPPQEVMPSVEGLVVSLQESSLLSKEPSVPVKVFKQFKVVREPRVVCEVAKLRRWASMEQLNERWRKEQELDYTIRRHEILAGKLYSLLSKHQRKFPRSHQIARTQMVFMQQNINYENLRESAWTFDKAVPTNVTNVLKRKGLQDMTPLTDAEHDELANRMANVVVTPQSMLTPEELKAVSLVPDRVVKDGENCQDTSNGVENGVSCLEEMIQEDDMVVDQVCDVVSNEEEDVGLEEDDDEDIEMVEEILLDGEAVTDYNKYIESFLSEDFPIMAQPADGSDVDLKKLTAHFLRRRVLTRLRALVLPVVTRLRQQGFAQSINIPLVQKLCATYFLGFTKEFFYALGVADSNMRGTFLKIVSLEIPIHQPQLAQKRNARYREQHRFISLVRHRRSVKNQQRQRASVPCGSYYDGTNFVFEGTESTALLPYPPICTLLDADTFSDEAGATLPMICSEEHSKCRLTRAMIEFEPDISKAFTIHSDEEDFISPTPPFCSNHLPFICAFGARCQLETVFSLGIPMEMMYMLRLFDYSVGEEVVSFLKKAGGHDDAKLLPGETIQMYGTFVHVLASRCTINDLHKFLSLGVDPSSVAFFPRRNFVKSVHTTPLAMFLRFSTIADSATRAMPQVADRFLKLADYLDVHTNRLASFVHECASSRIAVAYQMALSPGVQIIDSGWFLTAAVITESGKNYSHIISSHLGPNAKTALCIGRRSLTPVHTIRLTKATTGLTCHSAITVAFPRFSDRVFDMSEVRALVASGKFHLLLAIYPHKLYGTEDGALQPSQCSHDGVRIANVSCSNCELGLQRMQNLDGGACTSNGAFFKMSPQLFEATRFGEGNTPTILSLDVEGNVITGQLISLTLLLVGRKDDAPGMLPMPRFATTIRMQ